MDSGTNGLKLSVDVSLMSWRSAAGLVVMRSMLEPCRTWVSLHKICCMAVARKSGWLEGGGTLAVHIEPSEPDGPGGSGGWWAGGRCCLVEAASSEGLESRSTTTFLVPGLCIPSDVCSEMNPIWRCLWAGVGVVDKASAPCCVARKVNSGQNVRQMRILLLYHRSA